MRVSISRTNFFQRPLRILSICIAMGLPAVGHTATVSFEDLLEPQQTAPRSLSIEGIEDPAIADRITKISVLIYQGQFGRALDAAQTLADEMPELAQAWQLIGMAQANMGNSDEAIDAWDKAADLFDVNATPLVMKAELLLMQGKRDAARDAFRAASEKDGDNWPALEGLGNMAIQDGDLDAAEDYLGETLALAPEDALEPRLKLAAVHVAKDDFDSAEALLSAYRDAHPADASVEVALGKVAFAKGDAEAALNAYRAAAEIDADDPSHRLRLAEAFKTLGRLGDAEATLAEASTDFPEDTALSYQLGTLIAAQGRYGEAISIFETVLSKDPDATPFRSAASRTYFRMGDLAKAEEAALAAVDTERPVINDLVWLAVVQERAGKTDEAVQTYEKVVARAPDHWLALNNLAALLTATDPAQAVAHAETAAELSSQMPAVLDTLGWAQHRSGNDAAARETYDTLLASGEAGASVHYRAAQVMAAQGDAPGARDALTRALEIDPEFENAAEARGQLEDLD